MAEIPGTGYRAEPADHAIGFHLYRINALTDEKNITATITYNAGTGLWNGQPGNSEGTLSQVMLETAGAALSPSLDDLPPLQAAALLSANDSLAPDERRHEAAVRATMKQMEHIKALAGENNVSMMVTGDNGIAAFWSEGPFLLERMRQILEMPVGDPQSDWDALSPAEKDSMLSIAAGSVDWALDSKLDEEYVTEWFNGDPETLDLVRRAGTKPEAASTLNSDRT